MIFGREVGACPLFLLLPLAYFAEAAPDRNSAILEAHASGAYNLKEVADHFGLHRSSTLCPVRCA